VVRGEKEDSIFFTVGGRTVKGGGGITPDYEVKMPKSTPLLRECWRKGLFFSFAQERQHKYDSYEDALIDLDLITDFKVFINDHDLDVTTEGEKQFQEARTKLAALDSTNMDLIHAFDFVETFIIGWEATLFEMEKNDLRRRLLLELASIMKGSEFRVEESIKDDPVVIKAKEILQDPVAYSGLFQPKDNDQSF
jgi:carboxyl-terminal processing protease